MSEADAKYINPLTDFGFKKLFGEEPNKDILIRFLNDILPIDTVIEELTYTKNEQLGRSEVDRKAIYDLTCRAKTGEIYIVELQKAKQNYFKDRSVYYSSFPIQAQGMKGDWNFKLDAVFTVGILDFVFSDGKESAELFHVVELKDHNNRVFYDKLKYIYVELPKFDKSSSELKTNLDKWLYVFTHLSKLQERPAALQDKVFERLFEVAQISNFTEAERNAYEESLKYYRDIQNVVDTSRSDETIRIATNCIRAGMSDEQIAEVTGLKKEKINAIREELSK